jgi:hypothetical protein
MMAYSKSSGGIYIPNSVNRNVITFGAVSFWAENGMVCMSAKQDDGKEDFTQMPPSEAHGRRQAIIDMAKRAQDNGGLSAEKKKFYTDFIDGMRRVIAAAEEQGPYEDPSSRRDRVRRRAKQFGQYSRPKN